MLAAGKEREDKGSTRECEGSERVDPLLESKVRPRIVSVHLLCGFLALHSCAASKRLGSLWMMPSTARGVAVFIDTAMGDALPSVALYR